MSVMMANRRDVPFQPGGEFEEQPAAEDAFAQDQSGTYLNPAPSVLYNQNHTNNMIYPPSTTGGQTLYLSPQAWSPSTASEHISPKAFSSGDAFSDITQNSSPANHLEQFPELQFLPLPDATDLSLGGLGFVHPIQHLSPSGADANAQLGPTGASTTTPQHFSPDMPSGMNMAQSLSGTYYQEPTHMSLADNNTSTAAFSSGLMPPLDMSLNTNDYNVTTHMTSPIVRIEEYSRSDSPLAVPKSPAHSKRGHGSRKSSVHLSPYPDSSDDEPDDFAKGAQNRLGISPQAREEIKEFYVPSIDEIAKHRLTVERNWEVEEWLTHSEFSSVADEEDLLTRSPRKKTLKGRRRAKSTNDAAPRHAYGPNGTLGVAMPRFDDSRIPGPGIYIDERSEVDEAEDDDEPESPVADLNIQARDSDETYFPPMAEEVTEEPKDVKTQPWADTPSEAQIAQGRYQPMTSNAAMMRFKQRAQDLESASLAATIGSRRNWSDTDLSSLFSATGISKPTTTATHDGKQKQKDNRLRRGSFFDTFMPRRATNSNILKRKTGQPSPQPKPPAPPNVEGLPKKEIDVSLAPPKRIGSWGRAKSPKPEATLSRAQTEVKTPMPTIIIPPTGPLAQVKSAIRRRRSRTDISRSPGLSELMTQFGGPPVVSINSPQPEVSDVLAVGATPSNKAVTPSSAGGDTVFMDLAVRTDPIIPTLDGFRDQVRQLNPRVPEYLLERLAQEQHKRYKRLLQMKIDHLKSIKNGKCSANKFCFALGGHAELLPPRAGGKDSDGPLVGFQVMQPGMTEEDLEANNDGSMIPASFPSGIPLPPVQSLPAQFECPLCFKVKKFMKPSDWTKHVREDTQPFTCSFPNCSEPRSFSRKADWVRHESERHRQLESWTCNIQGCVHTCYRRDNFVQHLDREHKLPVVRVRLGRGQGSKSPNTPLESMQTWERSMLGESEMSADVTAIIEQCHHKTTKDPKQEPCKFCGNILSDWKKLEVHLSKHMEQISLPALRLVEQRKVDGDTKLSPIEGPPKSHLAVSPSSVIGGNAHYFSEPATYDESPVSGTLGPTTTFPPFENNIVTMGLASNIANTYPPPQMPPRKTSATQMANPVYGYENTAEPNMVYNSQAHAISSSNLHSSQTNLQDSAAYNGGSQRNSRYLQGMGNTYPPLLTIPTTDYTQQAYHDPSSSISMSPYPASEMMPTYTQQGGFSGSPTGSMYDLSGVPRTSTAPQNDPFSAYAQQGYYHNS